MSGVMVVEDISPGKLVEDSTHLHLPTFVVIVVNKNDSIAKSPVQNTTATVTLPHSAIEAGRVRRLSKRRRNLSSMSAKFCVHR